MPSTSAQQASRCQYAQMTASRATSGHSITAIPRIEQVRQRSASTAAACYATDCWTIAMAMTTILKFRRKFEAYLLYARRRLVEINLRVGGDLDLRRTAITALPDHLSVGDGFYLSGSAITALPATLRVKGNLDLSGSAIKALPDNLHVDGSLDLSGTAIMALPERLNVGRDLYLKGTTIKTIPARARVARRIVGLKWWHIFGVRSPSA